MSDSRSAAALRGRSKAGAKRPGSRIPREPAIYARRNPPSGPGSDEDLKIEEWRRFTDAEKPHAGIDFTIESVETPPQVADHISDVVAATRLRETAAIIGFARVDAPDPAFTGEEEDDDIKVVRLSTQPIQWVPATTARGEGIFLRFPEERLHTWELAADANPRVAALRETTVRRHSAKAAGLALRAAPLVRALAY